MEEQGWRMDEIDAIAVRGCPDGVFEAGAYEINAQMAADCAAPGGSVHPMALGPVIAYQWVAAHGVKAYNYDVVRVDELCDVARISGTPLFERSGASHTLNTKAVARQVAEEMGKNYETVTFIMCHMGGGIGVNRLWNLCTDQSSGSNSCGSCLVSDRPLFMESGCFQTGRTGS